MGRTVKVTDLTKLEGDPDPRKADVPDARMYLEFQARGPRQAGFLKFIAKCSERSPVARAIVVSILVLTGLIAAAVAHFAFADGTGPAWISLITTLVCLLIPAALYCVLIAWDRRR